VSGAELVYYESASINAISKPPTVSATVSTYELGPSQNQASEDNLVCSFDNGPEPTSCASAARTPGAVASGGSYLNATIPSICGHSATTLVNGHHTDIAPGEGFLSLTQPRGLGSDPVEINTDDGLLTAVVAYCNRGGVSWPNRLLFFNEDASFYAAAPFDTFEWGQTGFDYPGRNGITNLEAAGNSVVVTTLAAFPGDPGCCASGLATVRATPSDGQISLDAIEPATAGPCHANEAIHLLRTETFDLAICSSSTTATYHGTNRSDNSSISIPVCRSQAGEIEIWTAVNEGFRYEINLPADRFVSLNENPYQLQVFSPTGAPIASEKLQWASGSDVAVAHDCDPNEA